MEQVLLLVDDEPFVLKALYRTLRRDGYRILTAEGAKEALTILEQEPVAVILSDQRMPEMTGSELFGVVKERWPDTIRLILSGYTELASITDAINRGAVYKFLTKPWEDEPLRLQIAEAFRIYEETYVNRRLTDSLQMAAEELAAFNDQLQTRHEAEVARLQAELAETRLCRALVHAMPMPLALLDSERRLLWCNPAARTCWSGLAEGQEPAWNGQAPRLTPAPLPGGDAGWLAYHPPEGMA